MGTDTRVAMVTHTTALDTATDSALTASGEKQVCMERNDVFNVY